MTRIVIQAQGLPPAWSLLKIRHSESVKVIAPATRGPPCGSLTEASQACN